jgi:hypothetical protein
MTKPPYRDKNFLARINKGSEKVSHFFIIGQTFRVPLDAKRKTSAIDFKSFYQAVRGKGCGFQTVTDPSDALVMQAVHANLVRFEDPVQFAARDQPDGVGDFVTWKFWEPVVFKAFFYLVLDVREEVPTKSHVQHLNPTANRQEGFVCLQGCLE